MAEQKYTPVPHKQKANAASDRDAEHEKDV